MDKNTIKEQLFTLHVGEAQRGKKKHRYARKLMGLGKIRKSITLKAGKSKERHHQTGTVVTILTYSIFTKIRVNHCL